MIVASFVGIEASQQKQKTKKQVQQTKRHSSHKKPAVEQISFEQQENYSKDVTQSNLDPKADVQASVTEKVEPLADGALLITKTTVEPQPEIGKVQTTTERLIWYAKAAAGAAAGAAAIAGLGYLAANPDKLSQGYEQLHQFFNRDNQHSSIGDASLSSVSSVAAHKVSALAKKPLKDFIPVSSEQVIQKTKEVLQTPIKDMIPTQESVNKATDRAKGIVAQAQENVQNLSWEKLENVSLQDVAMVGAGAVVGGVPAAYVGGGLGAVAGGLAGAGAGATVGTVAGGVAGAATGPARMNVGGTRFYAHGAGSGAVVGGLGGAAVGGRTGVKIGRVGGRAAGFAAGTAVATTAISNYWNDTSNQASTVQPAEVTA